MVGCQCDQILRNFATLCKIVKVFVQIFGWVIKYLAKFCAIFGIFMLLGNFSLL